MYSIINPNAVFSKPIFGRLPDSVVQKPGLVAILDTTDMVAEYVQWDAVCKVYKRDFSACNFTQCNGGFNTSAVTSGMEDRGHHLIYSDHDGFIWDVWGNTGRRLFEGTHRGIYIFEYRLDMTKLAVRVMLLYNGIWYPADIIYDSLVPVACHCDYLPCAAEMNVTVNYPTFDVHGGVYCV